MTVRHPKKNQGRKDTRIKLVIPVPLDTTNEQKKIDETLAKSERHRANLAMMDARHAAKTARREVSGHQHNYNQLLRVTEDGNCVMACNCGAYKLLLSESEMAECQPDARNDR